MQHHRFVWDPLDSDDVGRISSLLIVPGTDHSHVVVGSQQFVKGDFGLLPSGPTTLHCWKVESVVDDVITLCRTKHSQIVELPPPLAGDFLQVVEVCAGLGGTSVGANACGFRPLVALDRSELACQCLRSNGMPIVLHGDLHDLQSLARLHLSHASSRFGLIAGFPCQPFSTLGHSLAFQDPRAHTFFMVLDLAFLVQASFVLLECVVAAGSHKVVTESIASFCLARGFRWTSVILHLDRSLPCYRTRWWCLMIPSWMPELQIPDLPWTPEFQNIAAVFPIWPCWSRDDELQLVLDDTELEAFNNPLFGTHSRGLDWNGKSPTLLHSMGNQLRDCPCGCRGPLSESLLMNQGLHGVLVESSWPDLFERHLHPYEAACLVGLPASMKIGTDLRAALSQIGQVASPIQAHWILLHLKMSLGLVHAEDIVAQHTQMLWAHVSAVDHP